MRTGLSGKAAAGAAHSVHKATAQDQGSKLKRRMNVSILSLFLHCCIELESFEQFSIAWCPSFITRQPVHVNGGQMMSWGAASTAPPAPRSSRDRARSRARAPQALAAAR